MKYILTITAGILIGDCIAICIRQIKILLRMRSRGFKLKRLSNMHMEGRLNRTFKTLINRDLVSLAVETFTSAILIIIACIISNKSEVSNVGIIALVCATIITLIFRIVRMINKNYILTTLSDILVLGLELSLVESSEEFKNSKDKKTLDQLKVCNSNMGTIYSIVDRIKTKKNYDESHELKSNISKLEKDLSLLGSMLKIESRDN